jgi:hypothetical protein
MDHALQEKHRRASGSNSSIIRGYYRDPYPTPRRALEARIDAVEGIEKGSDGGGLSEPANDWVSLPGKEKGWSPSDKTPALMVL